MTHLRTATAGLAALGLTLAAATALPTIAVAGPVEPRLAQAQQFSDEQIRAFANAALQVQELRRDYVEAMNEVGSEDERAALIEQTTSRMTTVVEEAPGITVGEYNAISQAAEQDPALAQAVERHMRDAMN